MTFKILTLNNISVKGLRRLPRERYEIASEISHPDAILVRSRNMHEMTLPPGLLAVARAGAGVNNIPVEALAHRGIPVFNAPGANANAVKELTLAAMFLAARNICPAWDYTRKLDAQDPELAARVEAGKKQFVGWELPGRTLGVVGLGAVGVRVANAARALGMRVLGYDPKITVRRAWELSSQVEQAISLDDLFARSDVVTLHTPLLEATRNLANGERMSLMNPGGVLLNLARGGIVDERAVQRLLDEGQLACYVTDFPASPLKDHPRVIALPHLGASTREAEENCATIAADTLRDYLEHGNVRNSVNFPEAVLPRTRSHRLTVANANVPNMVGQISTALAKSDINIADLLNQSRGDVAYTIVDLDAAPGEETLEEIRSIQGVLSARLLNEAPAGAD